MSTIRQCGLWVSWKKWLNLSQIEVIGGNRQTGIQAALWSAGQVPFKEQIKPILFCKLTILLWVIWFEEGPDSIKGMGFLSKVRLKNVEQQEICLHSFTWNYWPFQAIGMSQFQFLELEIQNAWYSNYLIFRGVSVDNYCNWNKIYPSYPQFTLRMGITWWRTPFRVDLSRVRLSVWMGRRVCPGKNEGTDWISFSPAR